MENKAENILESIEKLRAEFNRLKLICGLQHISKETIEEYSRKIAKAMEVYKILKRTPAEGEKPLQAEGGVEK
jgi:hypothetical protein